MRLFRTAWGIFLAGIFVFALFRLGKGIHLRMEGGTSLEQTSDAGAKSGESGVRQLSTPAKERFRDPFRKQKGLILVGVRDLSRGSEGPKPGRSYWLVERLDNSQECLLDRVRVISLRNGIFALSNFRQSTSRLRDFARSRDLPVHLRLVDEMEGLVGIEMCPQWTPLGTG